MICFSKLFKIYFNWCLVIPLTCPLSGYRTKFRTRFAKWLFANKFITLKKNHKRRLVGFGEMLLFNFKKILIVANVFLVSILFCWLWRDIWQGESITQTEIIWNKLSKRPKKKKKKTWAIYCKELDLSSHFHTCHAQFFIIAGITDLKLKGRILELGAFRKD